MKSWYDLTKKEQKGLVKEFRKKVRKPYMYMLKILLLFITIVLGLFAIVLFVMDNQLICYQNACEKNMIKFCIAFAISLAIYLTIEFFQNYKFNKAFSSWLEASKNIKK